MSSMKMKYALLNGEPASIEDVESGLKCGCVCPSCGEKLIARKGDKNIHHFAHVSHSECAYGLDSSLHLMAKKIFSEEKRVVLPEVSVSFSGSYKEPIDLSSTFDCSIDSVELEKRVGDIVPDIVIYSKGHPCMIEIFVTHQVDEEKRKKIEELGISAVEIDLSKVESEISEKKLRNLLVNGVECKKWIFNVWASKMHDRFIDAGEKLPVISRGLTPIVDNCPVGKKQYLGRADVKVMDDCIYCKYCIETELDDLTGRGSIICSGKQRISSIEDFALSLADRIRRSKAEDQVMARELIEKGICPLCRGRLVINANKRSGRIFRGCSNFPECKFTTGVED